MRADRLVERIKKDEGYSAVMYQDSVGVPTIGYGHNLEKGIPLEVSELIFKYDLKDAIDDLWNTFPWVMEDLNATRQEVLINMCFNLGISRLENFRRMWKALEAKDYTEAALEMLDSKWASQVGERAIRLSNAMKDGRW